MNWQNPKHSFSAAMISIVILLSSLAGGCGGGPLAKPVDPELARSTLKRVLDHWKSGGKMEDLQTQSPEVFVNDFDWILGAQLTGYEVLGDGDAQDANLFCDVVLHLQDAEGNQEDREVKYCIGTDPKLTVHRAFP